MQAQNELEKQTSIASIAISSEEERPKAQKATLRRLESYSNAAGLGEFEPFKLLYKCIHPESALLNNSSQLTSEVPSAKITSFREDLNQLNQTNVESDLLEINSVQSVIASRMGLRNFDDMENQDVVLEDQVSNKCKIYGIFDGHGEYGKVIAEAAKSIFKKLLQKYSEQIKNQNSILSIQDIVKKVLEKTNSYILHYHVEEAQFSGTTALIVLITDRKIYVFNIGNSRVVMGKYFKKTEKVEPFQITHDHTIARYDERARILKNGGVISPYKSGRGEQVGPERIWVKNQAYPGMFLTRTLGLSCAYKIGVISQPEINIIEYKSCFKYLILASDGFWSVEENDEAIKFFEKWKKGELEGLAGALMGEAVRRWSSKNVLMDDITLIFVAFN